MATPATALSGNVGDQIVVRANVTDANGLPASSLVNWTSSNSAVAVVQNIIDRRNGGIIFCIAAGTATITATSGSINTTFSLTITVPSPGTATTIDIGVDYTNQPVNKTQ
jgi:uncharacterized protein YjdB